MITIDGTALSLPEVRSKAWLTKERALSYLAPVVIPLVIQMLFVHWSMGLHPERFTVSEAGGVPTSDRLALIMNRPNPQVEELEKMFSAYGNYYEVNVNLLKHIAFCESRYDAKAVNGKYGGMYQFDERTWVATRKRMSSDPDPALRFMAEEAIRTAAFKIHNGGINAWVYCSRSYFDRI